MKVFKDILTIREALKDLRPGVKSIGLVPTMGALHEGHISLIGASIKENDLTIVTLFVNPIQFNNEEDLKNYPSTYEADLAILENMHCDILFAPPAEEMYPSEPIINFSFGSLEGSMEGALRPGHFKGVALIVMKLLNILQPTKAYFGQKDLQQFKIIEQMVLDTSLAVDLKMMPIVREKSGLALSSRNKRLTTKGRGIAAEINRALCLAVSEIKKGTAVSESIALAKNQLQQFQEISLEYLLLINLKDLQPVESTSGSDQLALCFAGYVEDIRLIDNQIIHWHSGDGNEA
jgi:pantoate--beta-alanine ligase